MNKKRKVGILTINDYTNYGNRLQNYATQEIIKSLGFEVKTIVNKTDYIPSKNNGLIKRTKKIIRMDPQTIYRKLKNKVDQFKYSNLINKIDYLRNRNKINKNKQKKVKNFKKFTNGYINETEYTIYEDSLIPNLDSKFDFFVTGSDQVWNPIFKHNSYIDFLTFTTKEKRVAFSPSFGISEIPKEYIGNFTKWLNGFDYLSVRENAGAKIIKKLTGKTAEVLVDPTMLLNKEQWLNIAKTPTNKPKKKYLLTYILGDLTKKRKNEINHITQEMDLEIVDLANPKNSDIFISGPREFLYLINKADIFLTDSFHGTVFSILFNIPFVVFERKGSLNMLSRINTILNKFNLQNRYEMNLQEINKLYDINFESTEKILKQERKKSIEYLHKCFFN